ncbi:MAG TPA: hypothetical protein VIN71_01525 [Pseudomonadales bacterium]
MKTMIKQSVLALVAAAGLGFGPAALAATGGGATIHNAATLSFAGGQVTAHINVEVRTIGSAPTFTVDDASPDGYTGDTFTLNYTITSTSNGTDNYSLAVDTVDNGVSAPSSLSVSPSTVTLGASIASRNSDPAGNIFIPAGSGTGLEVGDQVRINIAGIDYLYQIDSVTAGTVAFTVGNTTTAEVPTRLQVSIVTPGAPVIGLDAVVVAGTQIGEVKDFTVTVEAGSPLVPGVDGSHEVEISGNTSATGPGGTPVTFEDTTTGTAITVISGEATLLKEVRNVTAGGAFATSGVTARTGDVLEYRLTAGTVPGNNVAGAVVADFIAEYTSYVADSTTLNGNPVVDAGATLFPLDEGGVSVNSATGAAGEIVDGETAVILYQVTVD